MPKFVHIRRVDAEGKLLPTGGMTIAYSVVAWASAGDFDIVFNVAVCSNKDLYCNKTGREVAAVRLQVEGPIEVVSGAAHPRADTLIDWIADNYFRDYVINIKKTKLTDRRTKTGFVPRFRWESTFEPVIQNVRSCEC